MLRNPTKPAGHGVCRIRIYRETSRLKWFCQPPKCIRVVLGNTVKSTGKVWWDICSMRPRNTFLQYWHTPAMQAFPHWGTSRPEHPSCGGTKRMFDSHCKPNWLDWAFILTLVANLSDGALLKTIALLCISHSHFWRCKNWKRLMWSPWQK